MRCMRFAMFGNTRLQVRALLILIWLVWEKCFSHHTSCCVYLNVLTSQGSETAEIASFYLANPSIHPKASVWDGYTESEYCMTSQHRLRGKMQELQWRYGWVKMRKVMQARKKWWTHVDTAMWAVLAQLDNISPEEEEEKGASLNPFLNWLFQ